jgi:hypothetical protein
MKAPIALFAYRRPDHLRRVIRSLQANGEAASSPLFVFSDGPKAESEIAPVSEVRRVAAGAAGFADLRIIARDRNAGLANSIIEGVTRVLAEFGRVIVVEDDLVVSTQFLRYMNDALDLYAPDDEVASIHGYAYPVRSPLPETYFLRGADCWGWATWSRAWQHFESDGRRLLAALEERRLTGEFDLSGAYPYTRMLSDQIAGRNDSWAIRWHASTFLRGMLTLHPGRSLVQNLGHDSSGTHSTSTGHFATELTTQPARVERIPACESAEARRAVEKFLRSTWVANGGTWKARLRRAFAW